MAVYDKKQKKHYILVYSANKLNPAVSFSDRTSIAVGIACASLFLLVAMVTCVIKIASRDSSAMIVDQTVRRPETRNADMRLHRRSPTAPIGSSNLYLKQSGTLITDAPELDVEVDRHSTPSSFSMNFSRELERLTSD